MLSLLGSTWGSELFLAGVGTKLSLSGDGGGGRELPLTCSFPSPRLKLGSKMLPCLPGMRGGLIKVRLA